MWHTEVKSKEKLIAYVTCSLTGLSGTFLYSIQIRIQPRERVYLHRDELSRTALAKLPNAAINWSQNQQSYFHSLGDSSPTSMPPESAPLFVPLEVQGSLSSAAAYEELGQFSHSYNLWAGSPWLCHQDHFHCLARRRCKAVFLSAGASEEARLALSLSKISSPGY